MTNPRGHTRDHGLPSREVVGVIDRSLRTIGCAGSWSAFASRASRRARSSAISCVDADATAGAAEDPGVAGTPAGGEAADEGDGEGVAAGGTDDAGAGGGTAEGA